MFKKFQFNIIKARTILFIIPAVITLIGIVAYFTMGFNLDIDFIGGTTMQINMEKSLNQSELQIISDKVKSITGETPSSVQKSGDASNEVLIKTKSIDTDTRNKIFALLKETYNLKDTDLLAVDNVSPTVGNDLRNAAVESVIVACILMLIYITIRFEFLYGVAAIISLIHDIVIMIVAYIIFQIPINTSFIAATLTILGYSINATIIVFDRIRENRRLLRKDDIAYITDLSIWQTFARSVNTSVTTLLCVVMLIIFGVSSIREFAFPLAIGITAGAYSSVFLSGNVWYLLKQNFGKAK